MTGSYLAHGFDRSNYATTQPVHVIVDAQDGDDARTKLQQLFGDRYCWNLVENISVYVSEFAKNIVFISDQELYMAAPNLNPRRRGHKQ